MTRLVLIDGNAILHRAYHALPPLTAPDGSMVNAVYGFTSILIKLFNELKPTHMAVAFDRPEPTFRKSLYKEYQAKRPEMDDSLVSQIPKVQDVVRAFGIPIYDAAGFEADDVLATISSQCQMLNDKCQIDEIIIVTGDRDILQLVDDMRGIKVFMPTKGLSEGKLFGDQEVIEKMGVTPDKIPDLKALMGDASDNYPGVAGIGPKTAVELFNTFGDIEQLYKAIHNNDKRLNGVTEAVVQKLRDGIEEAKLSKDLATIRTNAPVEFDQDKAHVETLDTLDSRTKLAEFHFPSLVKRLSGKVEKEEKPKKKFSKKPEEKKEQLSLV